MSSEPANGEIRGAARVILNSVTDGVAPPGSEVAPLTPAAAKRKHKKKNSKELRDIYNVMPFLEDLVDAAVAGLYDPDPRIRAASMAALTRTSVDIFKKITEMSGTKADRGFSWKGLQAPPSSDTGTSPPSQS